MHEPGHARLLIPTPRTSPEEHAVKTVIGLDMVQVGDAQRVTGQILQPEVALLILAAGHNDVFFTQRVGDRVNVLFQLLQTGGADNHARGLLHQKGAALFNLREQAGVSGLGLFDFLGDFFG